MKHPQSQAFEALISEYLPDLQAKQREELVLFREFVCEENQKQNLTRLISPEEFFHGHVWDVFHLESSGFLSFSEQTSAPIMDLGSGVGVPGLISAILKRRPWVLAESEGKKAEFLLRTSEKLGLSGEIEVFSGRAEDLLQKREVSGIVSRAVGPVSRTYRWIESCSTWNRLILFKGPRWEEEWKEFQKSFPSGSLKLSGEYSYTGRTKGGEQAQRKIVLLERG